MLLSKEIKSLLVTFSLTLFWLTIWVGPASAQEGHQSDQAAFVYIVQPGDTLISIALRYNLSLADIALANKLSNFNLIFPGQQLTLPGVPATIQAEANTVAVDQIHVVRPGETLLKIAQAYGVSMEALILANHLANPDILQVGQTLRISSGPPPAPQVWPAPFAAIELSEPMIIQGRTLVIRAKLSAAATLSGNFEDQPLFFNDSGNGQFWSIVPVHALAEPNIYPLTLTAHLANGTQVTTSTNVKVVEGPYRFEDIQLDDQRGGLLDPELIRIEQEKLDNLWSQVSPQPRWTGSFWYPAAVDSLRITSNFGARRSYNGSSTIGFHSGTDFGGDVGRPIYAPAAGTVVLAERLVVRGNVVLLDHGLGLFSGYWHQSEFAVVAGQEVEPGDLIGFMGDTGLVTGPHLHWELRLNGIAIDPLQWVQQEIP